MSQKKRIMQDNLLLSAIFRARTPSQFVRLCNVLGVGCSNGWPAIVQTIRVGFERSRSDRTRHQDAFAMKWSRL